MMAPYLLLQLNEINYLDSFNQACFGCFGELWGN